MGWGSNTMLWLGGCISIGTLAQGSAQVEAGLNLLQLFLAVAIGSLILVVGIALNDQFSYNTGAPYAVQLRSAFGTKGNVVPSLIRGLPAIVWYGYQTWLGGAAINNISIALFGFDNIWVFFIVFQIVQILLSIKGFQGAKMVGNIGGVVISIAMIYLLYLCITEYGDVVSTKLIDKSGTWGMPFVAAIIAFFGNSTTVMLNAGDYSREMEDGLSVMKRGSSYFLAMVPATILLGVIGAADVVKPTSAQAIRELKKMGIQVIMLTGDNERTAKAIQRQLDIDTVIAEVLPQDKEREVAKLQESGRKVAMVGDGINDAPALARADVGIAIGAGTDVAIESADIVLMKNDLLDVVTAVGLSKAVIRNIKENLFWAFFYNVCGIPLAAGVFYTAFGLKLSPMFGAAAMSLSSLFVVSNALRLRFFHVLKKPQQEENIRSAEVNTEQTVNTAAKAADNKEEMNMYTMKIEGMMCPHCQAAVTKALNGIEGVKAEVNLEKKEAYVEAPDSVSKEDLTKAVVDAGYEVVSVE